MFDVNVRLDVPLIRSERMEPVAMFGIAVIVFLSLPLPMFLSSALVERPRATRSLIPFVFANAAGDAALGLLIIATSTPPVAAVSFAGFLFLACGMEMFRRLAKTTVETSQ